LDDPVLEVRFAAAYTLATFGRSASDALPILLEWVNSEIVEEAFIASIAVIRIDEAYREALVPVLLESLERLESGFRAKGVCLLTSIVEGEPRLVVLLARCYRHSRDKRVRRAIVDVFAIRSPEVREAVPVLVEAVRDEDRDIASAAARGLCILREKASAAVPNLITALDAELARGEPATRREKSSRHDLLWNLCTAIGCIGPAAKAAVPLLQVALRHHYEVIRNAARRAVAQIEYTGGKPTAAEKRSLP
jgi:HEAT repeat protein